MASNKKVYKINRSEILYYRMLVIFLALTAEIFGFLYATQTAKRADALRLYIAPALMIFFGALAVLFLVIFSVRIKKGINEQHKAFSSGFVWFTSLWIASTFALYYRLSEKRLIAYIVVTAALFFVCYLYDREFFIFSLFCAIGGGLLSMINSATVMKHYIIAAIVAIICTIFVVIAVIGKNKPIEMRAGEGRFMIFDKTYKSYPFYIAAGILLAGVLLSFILDGSLIYSLVVLFGYYLVYTVTKTIQMM